MCIVDIFLTHLKPFLDKLICKFLVMLKNLLKKIKNFKNKQDLDAKFWIQKSLLCKNFKSSSFYLIR